MDDKESQALVVTGLFWFGIVLLAFKLFAPPKLFEGVFVISLVLLGCFVVAYFLAFAYAISYRISKRLINSLHRFFERL